MDDLVDDEHRQAARDFRKYLAVYREAEDLINIGAYRPGANPEVDRACSLISGMRRYLEQDSRESSDFDSARRELLAIFKAEGGNG
jgi:flagellum-specific ATP synthase